MSFRKLQKTNEAQNDFGKKIKKFVMLVLENMIDSYFGYIFEKLLWFWEQRRFLSQTIFESFSQREIALKFSKFKICS